ncbi:MAG: ComEC family competence protein [Bacteroidia bacterium]|nr:ComEC family competence protein [Bacteroidia bacterium]
MQHSFWHKVPIVRILLSFVTGVGTSMFYPVNHYISLVSFGVFLTAFILLPHVFKAFQQRWFTGLALMCMFYWVGILVHTYQNNLFDSRHFSYLPHAKYYLIMVDEEPIQKTNSVKMRTKVLQGTDSLNHSTATTGNLLLYISKKSLTKMPKYGDVLAISAKYVNEVSAPKNPYEFDYKRYLAFNHIHHQAYLQEQQISYTQINNGKAIFTAIYNIQHYFKQVLHQYVKSSSEIGVAQALLYGFDDEIDEETMSAYANTGTLHVLAVSGMHVGIIFLIVSKLLWFMDKNKKLLFAKRIIIVIFLWMYSALCGLSPSILRATVMFTFIVTAQILNRKSNIYNTLAASCFTLLVVDANMLANVGFQLSYMAVLGIVFIQPMMYKWYVPSNWFVDQIWKITSVSIAAQIATSPIGILYFHQFPNCFLFSNLLIIPLTTGILYGSIFLLVVSKINIIATYVGIALKYLILFTNWLVMFVEDTPNAYVNGLQISIFQSILLYVLALSIIFYFMYQYKWLLQISLVSLLYFVVLNGLANYTTYHQKKLVVYSINQSNAVQIVNGNNSYFLLDDNVRYDKQKFRFHLQQHVWQLGVNNIDTITPSKNNWLKITANQKQILLSGIDHLEQNQLVDIFVVRNDINPTTFQKINTKQVILSGGIKQHQAKKIKSYFNKLNIPVFDVQYSGAFQLSL